MQKNVETQVDTVTWAASATQNADLLKVGVITRIYATVELTPNQSLATANDVDGLFRVLANLKVSGGSDTYFTLPSDVGGQPGTMLHYMNRVDGFGLGHSRAQITAPSRTYNPITFVLHAGSRPQDRYGRDNPFDLSALIPAGAEGQLKLEWTTGPNSVMDDTTTISSAVIRATICRVMGTEAEILREMQLQDVVLPPGVKAMKPAWTGEVHAIAATASDYSLERNFPTGGYCKRVVVLAQDATGTRPLRAGDEVTGIAIKLKDGTTIVKSFIDRYQVHLPVGTAVVDADGAPPFQGFAPEGIAIVDLRGHQITMSNRDYGLYLGASGVGVGDVKVGYTVTTNATGDDVLTLFERYLPILPHQALV